MSAARVAAVRQALTGAERASGAARRTALTGSRRRWTRRRRVGRRGEGPHALGAVRQLAQAR
jgi:hypothetical protein